MPRTSEQNNRIRETTVNKIMDAALDLYVRYGYAGTVMDMVAKEAKIAKGLLYYYYKSKKILFKDLFDRTLIQISKASTHFFERSSTGDAVQRLVIYSIGIFGMGMNDPRTIQFAMRMPFDAFAVFGEKGWKKGLEASEVHGRNLKNIIIQGIEEGTMESSDADMAADSFWTLYVAGLFRFTKMMDGKVTTQQNHLEVLKSILAFGMAGLKVDEKTWKTELNLCIGKSHFR